MGVLTPQQEEFQQDILAQQAASQAQVSGFNQEFGDITSQIQDIFGDESGGLIQDLLGAEFEAADPTAAIAGLGQVGEAVGGTGGLLEQLQALGTGEGDILSQIRDQLLGISAGEGDQAFQRFQETQLGSLERDIAGQEAKTAERLSRRGIGGSAAENIFARQAAGGTASRQSLLSQIGLQRLGRQDQARLQAAGVTGDIAGLQSGLIGQQAGLQELLGGIGTQQFGLQQAGVEGRNLQQQLGFEADAGAVENLANLAGLITAQGGAAAQLAEAGKPSGGGVTVLCTEVYQRGDMSDEIYRADDEYGAKQDSDTLDGYRLWAMVLVGLMQRHRFVYVILKPFILIWANNMAAEMGVVNAHASVIGKVMCVVGIPACRTIGKIKRLISRLSPWLDSELQT